MRGYLLDTHIWLWHVFEDERLARGLRRVIDNSRERCWLSPISVWELGLLVERGRMDLDLPLERWVDEALSRVPLREAPVTREVAVRVHQLKLANKDPADRFLAATALTYDLTIVTVDPYLVEAKDIPTRSH